MAAVLRLVGPGVAAFLGAVVPAFVAERLGRSGTGSSWGLSALGSLVGLAQAAILTLHVLAATDPQ